MEVTRLFELPERWNRLYPKKNALNGKENGKWVSYSTGDFLETADDLSYGLLSLGLQKNDKVLIIANNRPEWNYADIGILQAGGIDVPIYPTISDDDLSFIISDCKPKFAFVSSRELFEKVSACCNDWQIERIFTFSQVENADHWSVLIEAGKKASDQKNLEMVKSGITSEETATILYTSGTTGKPKGVMLSHRNLLSNVVASKDLCPVDEKGSALSFLPLNHVYERMLTYYYMFKGISIYYAESLETIGENLKEIKPEMFTCVPRLLEKVYDKIISKGNELTGIKRKLFFWAVGLGEKYEHDEANGWWYKTRLNIASKLIFSKWREALGGNVKVAVSGGAALNPRLCRIFWAAGIPVLEGYGLTETSPVIAVNTMEKGMHMFGTVGPLLNNVKVKIAEDGEILVSGPNVMKGYYNRPDATEEVIDSEGWFHTGDIGTFVDEKFLKITDRKKEIFKTSGGKYIAPQMIENRLKECSFIEQVMVFGENQKFASAFIVPAFPKLRDWAANRNIGAKSNQELIGKPEVIQFFRDEVEKVNSRLAQFETIKKFELLPSEWSVAGGELTPKLSLKRKVILEKNRSLLEKIYQEKVS